tara:strand:- start:193 stop:780 length:588 start_codon:yes stop_codon:yes gene_type:complete
MTAITPLEFIHKKGVFGDHHKQNEIDLLKISEVKNLTIIQIVHYKKSKLNIEDIKIDDLKLPTQSPRVSSNNKIRILWNSPKTWLILSNKEDIKNIINESCSEKDFAVTDISHSRAVIQIKGLQAREVLKKGSPINYNELKVNECAGTVYNGITIVVDLLSDKPDTFNLLTLRSFGESFYHHITDASLEFGYAGV